MKTLLPQIRRIVPTPLQATLSPDVADAWKKEESVAGDAIERMEAKLGKANSKPGR